MYNINVSKARANIYNLVRMAIEDGEVVNINTKDGNAVILSETDYNALLETLYLSTNPQFKQSLIEGRECPLEDCVPESDVKW